MKKQIQTSIFVITTPLFSLGGEEGTQKSTNSKTSGIHINKTPKNLAPEESNNDKSQYHLFNPTPNHLLRDLAPDRPDVTESPTTIDAGRFAIEASLFDWRRNGSDDTYTYGALNLKAGLTHNTDLQAVIDVRSDGDYFGDLTLRLKHNIYGNDSGSSALAIMPFVKIPTASDEWETGLIIPFGTELTESIGLGLMAELDYVHDGNEHVFEFVHTAVLGFTLTERLGSYTEYIGILKENHYEAYLAAGLTFEVNQNFLLDFGAQAGLNDDSEDFGLFTGFTKRF